MGRKGVSLLCAVFTLLCLEVGVSQENCATAIDEQLDCDPFDLVNGELQIDCTGFDFVVSHNIPSSAGDLQLLTVAIICGTECTGDLTAETRIFSVPYQDDQTLNGTVMNVSSGTPCTVSGCYDTVSGGVDSFFRFSPKTCTLAQEPEVTTAAATTLTITTSSETTETRVESTTSEREIFTPTDAENDTTLETTTLETTQETTSLNDTQSSEPPAPLLPTSVVQRVILAASIPIAVLTLLLGVATVTIILLLIRHRKLRKTRLYDHQLYSMAHFGDEDEIEPFDANMIKLRLSKLPAASEPSLLLALHQYPVSLSVLDTVEVKKYLAPDVTASLPPAETDLTDRDFEYELSNKNEDSSELESSDGAPSKSVSYASELSMSFEREISPCESVHLDRPVLHDEERGYYEMESSKKYKKNQLTSLRVVNDQECELPTIDSPLSPPVIGFSNSPELDSHLSGSSEGYLDYESGIASGNQMLMRKQHLESEDIAAVLDVEDISRLEQSTPSSSGYIDYQSDVSSTAVMNIPAANQAHQLSLDMESEHEFTDSDSTLSSRSQSPDSEADPNFVDADPKLLDEHCAVVFEFSNSSSSGSSSEVDKDYEGLEEGEYGLEGQTPLLVSDSPTVETKEMTPCSRSIAFDFGVSPSSIMKEPADEYLAASPSTVIDSRPERLEYAENSGNRAETITPAPLINSELTLPGPESYSTPLLYPPPVNSKSVMLESLLVEDSGIDMKHLDFIDATDGYTVGSQSSITSDNYIVTMDDDHTITKPVYPVDTTTHKQNYIQASEDDHSVLRLEQVSEGKESYVGSYEAAKTENTSPPTVFADANYLDEDTTHVHTHHTLQERSNLLDTISESELNLDPSAGYIFA